MRKYFFSLFCMQLFLISCKKAETDTNCIKVKLVAKNNRTCNYPIFQDIEGIIPKEFVSEFTSQNITFKDVFTIAGPCNQLNSSSKEGDIFFIKIKSSSVMSTCPTCSLIEGVKALDFIICPVNDNAIK
jgi:hypothetical protein